MQGLNYIPISNYFLFASWCLLGYLPLISFKSLDTWNKVSFSSMVTQLFHLCPHGPAQRIVIQFPRVHSGALQLTSWLQEASVSRPCVVSFACPGRILHHLLFVLHTGGQRQWRRRQRKMPEGSRGHEWQLVFSQESSCYCGWIGRKWQECFTGLSAFTDQTWWNILPAVEETMPFWPVFPPKL